MAVKTIDAALVKKMFLAGAINLNSKKEWVNDLNVFPVPDGDTGTNMTMTIMSAAHAVEEIANPTLENLSKAISSGSLRGARGNSGVILSQLCRGFTKEIKTLEVLDISVLVAATQRATETAYKAVMKPKEGTILTVAKAISDKAAEVVEETDDLEAAITEIIEHAEYVLSKTPDMLPVLKEAGVVDSGGQGLVLVLRGMLDALQGKVTDFSLDQESESVPSEGSAVAAGKGASMNVADIKFGYCTEFIIKLDKEFGEKEEMEFKAFLQSIGDSIVCVSLDDIVKIHVHTNHPGQVFEEGLKYGQLSRMKVDNMREEHENKLVSDKEVQTAKAVESKPLSTPLAEEKKDEPKKEFGFVTVVAGSGLAEIFRGLGVDQVIEGGQTMNPSTADIADAAEKVNADTVFILPNNKNIIMAANQAADIVEDKKVVVIPTKTIPQGISAMISFEPTRSADENLEDIKEALEIVKSGEVTYAVRDTSIDGTEIKTGNMMAMDDNGLAAVGDDLIDVTVRMIEKMADEDSELITLYYGSDVKEEDAEKMQAAVADKFPDFEVELQNGGQPVYYYFVSVE